MRFIDYKCEDGAITPTKRSEQDAGYDIYSMETVCLDPGDRAFVSVGVRLAMPQDLFAFITNTSTAGAEGVICLSHIIDAGYRGDVGPILFNTSRERYCISPGDKIAQLVFLPVVGIILSERAELSPGNRADKKF